MNALVNDVLTGRRVVKAFGREAAEVARFGAVNEGVFAVNVETGLFTSTVFPLINLLMGIGGLVVWGYGGLQVVSGGMTFGTLMTFTGYIAMIYGPLEFMTHIGLVVQLYGLSTAHIRDPRCCAGRGRGSKSCANAVNQGTNLAAGCDVQL